MLNAFWFEEMDDTLRSKWHRFDIDDGDVTRALEKRWKAYQKENRLDLNGKVAKQDVDRLSPPHCHSH